MIDVDGACSNIQLEGHMNIIKHTMVLKALEQRANRFRKKGEDGQGGCPSARLVS
jgi:hypothetical protein